MASAPLATQPSGASPVSDQVSIENEKVLKAARDCGLSCGAYAARLSLATAHTWHDAWHWRGDRYDIKATKVALDSGHWHYQQRQHSRCCSWTAGRENCVHLGSCEVGKGICKVLSPGLAERVLWVGMAKQQTLRTSDWEAQPPSRAP